MSIEAIGAIGTVGVPESEPAIRPAKAVATDFSQVIGEGMRATDQAIRSSEMAVREFAAGHEVAPHEVMISMEEARMRLMLLTEVRNKLVEGYQELSRMQM